MADIPALKVRVGQVTYDDTEALVEFPQGKSAGVITDYMITNHYERDLHTYVGSNTSEQPFQGATVSVVRIGGPVLIWVCEWTACRIGSVPPVPDPTPADGNWRLLDAALSQPQFSLGPSGKDFIYRVSGTYVYCHMNPGPSIFSDAVFPRAPWVREGGGSRKVPADRVVRGLADALAGAGYQGSDGGANAGVNLTGDSGQGFLGVQGFTTRG